MLDQHQDKNVKISMVVLLVIEITQKKNLN